MAYFNFLRSLLGAGILGLPLAISQAGIILGPILAMSIALLIIHMHLTMLNCLNEISRQMRIPYISYRYGFRLALLHGPFPFKLLGHHGQYMIVVLMILSQLGICTVCVIFTTDSLRDLMDWETSHPAMLVLLFLYLTLEYFMKTLKIVSYISMLGNFLNLIGLILVIYHIFQAPRGVVKYATTDLLSLSFVVGSCLFNLSAIAVTLSLDRALKDPTVLTKKFGVITVGILVPALVSSSFGVLGYWSFGAMEENILRYLPFDETSAMVAIGLYLISIAFAYPIQCYPATQLIVDIVQHRKVDYIPPEETLKSIEAFSRPIIVLASFLLCYMFPYQAAVVAFMGNFCTSLVGLVFPATMEICILYPNDFGKFKVYLIKDLIIILFGLAAWFCGLLLCGELMKNLPLWTWDCVNKKCVPTKAKLPDEPQSLETCNRLCSTIHLWPQPTGQVTFSTSAVPARADLFQLQIESFPSLSVREHLRETFDLFRQDLRKLENSSFGFEEWHSVALRVAINRTGSPDPRMLLSTDENYKLTVHRENNSLVAKIISNSFCGARHGLETLSQLIWFDPYVGSLMMFEAASVEDGPRFRYRGLLLDTARNYFAVPHLLRTIDGMAASKLNTFHWHATDSQAFPLLLNSVPQLALNGAYDTKSVYTADDIRKVVQRARLRGIRVLLEVDVPAHVGNAWDWRSPGDYGKLILCIDKQPWHAYCSDPPCGELNPQNSHVFDILESVYREITQLTEVDDIYHLGGNYVSNRCWSENFNGSDPAELWLEFTRKALKRLASVHGQLPNLILLWSSHLSDRIKIDLKDFIGSIGLQERSVGWAQKHLSGVRTVISHEDAWDLNSGLGAWHEVTDGAPYNPWQRVYEYRPWARGSGCLEGGEVMVWSSTLSAGGLDSRVWPRAAAFAERLWADRPEAATRLVQARLDVHRSRLLSRGIKASPIWSMWCSQNPFTCD